MREIESGVFIPFGVHTTHDGWAVWGEEESFGNFVMICSMIEADSFYLTVYAHLQVIAQENGLFFMPKYKPKKRKVFWPEEPLDDGIPLIAGTYLGDAGTTGWTNNLVQLHFELHEFKRVGRKWERKKIDPYGVYDDIDSGKYPQPGQSLSFCPNHFWASDTPSFA
ncbi:MAG TPA: hypothetical protein P5096_02090 [Patescibacteria group bacterium]|nr:hypothetical protein [Patescibacteria group bacterium]